MTEQPYEAPHFLSWTVNRNLREVLRFDGGVWRFVFEETEYIQTQCLWRIVRDDRIVLTNEDDGHQFGLPAPVDAAIRAADAFSRSIIRAVKLRAGTADILIEFDRGIRLEIIPTSSGYESWHICGPSGIHVVAGGGGEIYDFTPPAS